MFIFTSKITRSSLGPNLKNFVDVDSAEVPTETARNSEHRAAHPKSALLTRSTCIILMVVAKFKESVWRNSLRDWRS